MRKPLKPHNSPTFQSQQKVFSASAFWTFPRRHAAFSSSTDDALEGGATKIQISKRRSSSNLSSLAASNAKCSRGHLSCAPWAKTTKSQGNTWDFCDAKKIFKKIWQEWCFCYLRTKNSRWDDFRMILFFQTSIRASSCNAAARGNSRASPGMSTIKNPNYEVGRHWKIAALARLQEHCATKGCHCSEMHAH